LPAESLRINRIESLNGTGIHQEKVGELAVLIIGDFCIVHEKRANRYLLVKVDLCRSRVFVCLPHMKGTSRNGNHPVRYRHNPSLPSGHTNEFALISAPLTSQAKQAAGAGCNSCHD